MASVTRAPARPFEHHVLDFLAYLELERGLSRNTLEAYRSDLLQYGDVPRAPRARRPAGRPHATSRGFLDELAPGTRRPAAGRAGDAAAQDRLPAVLLPPPAPRGGPRGRPDGRPARPAGRPAPAAGAQPRRGRCACWRRRAATDAGGAARPRAAGAHVRLRPAGERGDRHARRRRRPRGRGAARPRQGLQGAARPDRPRGARRRARLPARAAARSSSAPATRRTCSSTSAAAGSAARGSTRSSRATRPRSGSTTG